MRTLLISSCVGVFPLLLTIQQTKRMPPMIRLVNPRLTRRLNALQVETVAALYRFNPMADLLNTSAPARNPFGHLNGVKP